MFTSTTKNKTKTKKRKVFKIYDIFFLIMIIGGLYLATKPLFVYKQIENSVTSAETTLSIFKEKALQSDTLNEVIESSEPIADFPELKRVVIANVQNQVVTDDGSGGIIGKVVIPNVDISLPVYQGVGGDNLLQGAATHKVYQTMGQGNYVLASHYAYSNQLFSNLGKVIIGDLIYISDYVNIYVYEVTENIVADPNDSTARSMLSDQEDKQLITLYTCSDDGKMRTVVIGELKGYIEFNNASEKYLKLF